MYTHETSERHNCHPLPNNLIDKSLSWLVINLLSQPETDLRASTLCRQNAGILVCSRPVKCLNWPPPEPIGEASAPSIQLDTVPTEPPDFVRQPIAPILMPNLDSKSSKSVTRFSTWSTSIHE